MAAAAREKFLAAEAAASSGTSTPTGSARLKQELKPSNPASVIADTAVAEALAAGTWKQVTDPTGRVYYYNPTTKATTWNLANELKKSMPASVVTPASPAVQTTHEAKAASEAKAVVAAMTPSTTPVEAATPAAAVASLPSQDPVKPLLKSESGSFTGARPKDAAAPLAQQPSAIQTNAPTTGLASTLKPNPRPLTTAAPLEKAAIPSASEAKAAFLQRDSLAANRPTINKAPTASSVASPTSSPRQVGGIREFLQKGQGDQPALGSKPPLGASTDEGPHSASRLQLLLDENNKLQQMIAAGMVRNSNGPTDTPLGADFGGKLDALTRTNHALTIQVKRLSVEHDAMVRALTEANVKIHELQMELDEQRAVGVYQQQQPGRNQTPEKIRNPSPARAGFGLVAGGEREVGATMAHLRDSNRQLVQQIGELSTLLARALADQSFATSLMVNSQGGALEAAGSEPRESSGPRFEGFKSILGGGSSPVGPSLHNHQTSYLSPHEMPQYETLPPSGGGGRNGASAYQNPAPSPNQRASGGYGSNRARTPRGSWWWVPPIW